MAQWQLWKGQVQQVELSLEGGDILHTWGDHQILEFKHQTAYIFAEDILGLRDSELVESGDSFRVVLEVLESHSCCFKRLKCYVWWVTLTMKTVPIWPASGRDLYPSSPLAVLCFETICLLRHCLRGGTTNNKHQVHIQSRSGESGVD